VTAAGPAPVAHFEQVIARDIMVQTITGLPWEKAQHLLDQARKSGELLKGQLSRLQVRAVELIREGKLDRAREELVEGQQLLLALLADAPDDVSLAVHLGYLYKAVGQALQAAGPDQLADKSFEQAAVAFRRVKDEVPATGKTVSDIASALNGLGNVCYSRGQLEQALGYHRQATDLTPDYAYAWHDMFGVYQALAQKGKIDLDGMRLALRKLKETGAGIPGLDAGYLGQLEGYLRYWEGQAPKKGKQKGAAAPPKGG
jgi:tetratricopeptide (TPR) repeat protein